MGIALAISAFVGTVAALVTWIRTDAEKNPDRDWHAEAGDES
jgi:hypothetical protein